jgi:hypothetical protein
MRSHITYRPFLALVSEYFLLKGIALYRPTFSRPAWLSASALAALLCLAGCLSTELKSAGPPSNVYRLAAINTRPLILKVESVLESEIGGHQYVLIFIPFGRIRVPAPQEYVYDSAYTALSLRGYHPLPPAGYAANAPKLNIVLNELKTSAYDFLLFRRVSCRIALTARLISPDGRTLGYWEAVGESASLRRFGFAPQLEKALHEAVELAVDDVLQNLRI